MIPCPIRSSLSRALALAAALAISVTAAPAAVRYVSPAGNDANSGASPASPWTLARANRELEAGDLCVLLPGGYETSIDPQHSGTSMTRRITYLGSIANPGSIVVPSIQPNQAFVTVKGVACTDAITLRWPARWDSIADCRSGGLQFWGAKHCVVARNTIRGRVAFLANEGLPCYSSQKLDRRCVANSEYDTLRGNRIELGTIWPGDRSFEFKAWTQRCRIDSNRVSGTFDDKPGTPADGGIAVVTYNSYRLAFQDNHWEFEAARNHHNWPNTTWDAFYLRDSLHSTTFVRDTILAGVHSAEPREIRLTLSASGSFPGAIHDVTMDRCILRASGDFLWQGGFDHWTLDRCVFQSRSGLAYVLSDWVGSRIRHCTFWASTEVLRVEGPSQGQHVLGTGNELTSNIFYSLRAKPAGGDGGVVMWKDNTRNFTSDGNLYFTPAFDRSPGDRSIVWSGYFASPPGRSSRWFGETRQDGASRHGSPAFFDSSWAGFDARIRANSCARGAGLSRTDAGALAFGASIGDVTPPAPVTDLAASHVEARSLLLTWTASGDDGRTGRAALVDVRYARAPVTAANFTGGIALVPAPVPQPGGSPQSYVITQLQPGTRYWFALRSCDEKGNWSRLSNVVMVQTPPE